MSDAIIDSLSTIVAVMFLAESLFNIDLRDSGRGEVVKKKMKIELQNALNVNLHVY